MAKGKWLHDHYESVAGGQIHWTPEAFLARAETAVEKTISRLALTLEDNVRLSMKYPGPTKSNPTAKPSKPLEVPHVRTGTLRASIDSETYRKGDQFIGRVGTNIKYGRYLELGTVRMPYPTEHRPYLRPALDALRPRIVADLRRARIR